MRAFIILLQAVALSCLAVYGAQGNHRQAGSCPAPAPVGTSCDR